MFEAVLIMILIAVTAMALHYRAKAKALEREIEARALKLFEKWRSEREEAIKREAEKAAEEKARLLAQKIVSEREEAIRREAIERSMATILGKVGEQLAPLVLFATYGINPKDLRFLGSPVDYIAFKGLSEGRPEKIVFIEIKAGKKPVLTETEKMIRTLIERKEVEWLTIHLPTEIERLKKMIEEKIKS